MRLTTCNFGTQEHPGRSELHYHFKAIRKLLLQSNLITIFSIPWHELMRTD